MFNVIQSRFFKLVQSFFFFEIRRKLGQILVLLAKSLKFLCSNLNFPVFVGCILLCQLWEFKSHEACSKLSKCLKFMFYYYNFFGS